MHTNQGEGVRMVISGKNKTRDSEIDMGEWYEGKEVYAVDGWNVKQNETRARGEKMENKASRAARQGKRARSERKGKKEEKEPTNPGPASRSCLIRFILFRP